MPSGVFRFDTQEAQTFGQNRAFTLDLRRLALLPITAAWFPRLDQPGQGVLGRAPPLWERRFQHFVDDTLTRRPELIERLGPLWPRRV